MPTCKMPNISSGKQNCKKKSFHLELISFLQATSADLEAQLVQLNHYDGVLSNK